MREWHAELGFLVEVALIAIIRILLGIDNGAGTTTRFDVLAAGTVAGFTTDVLYILTLGLQSGVIRSLEIADRLLMTRCTFLGTNELRTRNRWRSHQRPASAGAGNDDDR